MAGMGDTPSLQELEKPGFKAQTLEEVECQKVTHQRTMGNSKAMARREMTGMKLPAEDSHAF